MEDRGEPCPYCVNYNELRDALNLIEELEETVQATWDGVRDMLEEIAQALSVPAVGPSGPLTNGELVDAVIGKAKEVPQIPTVAESAGFLYYALNQIVGEGRRAWPTDLILEGHEQLLNQALDAYENSKRAG